MRIIQTVNDTIRLLFNPKTEIFSLSDFLLVRDSNENFLAQVVEVYDDKFDQEANVAKIKLIYKIKNGNEIVPYDNYTPSRECEVAKIKQSEIEKCINLNKKTILLGNSAGTKEKMEINTDFFDNNCVIFSDKYEQTNQIFENLAPRLSNYKHVLILDFSGTCLPLGANSFVAGENFKMPLSSETIDYIQQKTLLRAKLETQVVLGDVFEEVKKFLSSTEENYIPFPRFVKVIQTQCKQTPSVELLVLFSWLKKYARMGIFAKNKREFEGVLKSVSKNKITSIDFSNIKTEWQKEYVEYVINSVREEAFVLIRLNDNNINNDILNSIYLKKKNISFIPSFAYGYKKASYIMDFAQNYILMPTLNPKRDFAHANFQIQSLNKESYMIFGENTKDFIFTLENEAVIKKHPKEEDPDKGKMFISLNLQLEDMTPLELRPDNFEVKPVETRKKRLQEEISLQDVLGAVEADRPEDFAPAKEEENFEEAPYEEAPYEGAPADDVLNEEGAPLENAPLEDTPPEEVLETLPQEEKTDEAPLEEAFGEDELDYFENTEEEEAPLYEPAPVETTKEAAPEIKEAESEAAVDEPKAPTDEPKAPAEKVKVPTDEPDATAEKNKKAPAEKNEEIPAESAPKVENPESAPQAENHKSAPTENPESAPVVNPESAPAENSIAPNETRAEKAHKEPKKASAPKVAPPASKAPMPKIKEENGAVLIQTEAPGEIKSELADYAKSQEDSFDEEALDDDILDSIDEENAKPAEREELPADEKPEPENIEGAKDVVSTIIDEVVKEKIEDKIKSEETVKKLDSLNEEAEKQAQSTSEEDEIESEFEKIMNETEVGAHGAETLKINDKVSIDLNKVKKEIKTPERKLPIFNEEENQEEASVAGFKEGDKVSHEKYGEGEILKVINYGARCLLQIEFPEIGKRLLDPKIAKLKPADEA